MNLPATEVIESKIYIIRGQRVMIDSDLATLYGVETKALNQAVRRNIDRFPGDFMFKLTEIEWENMRSQFVTGSHLKTNLRYLPFAFTEFGIAMLSGVLKSDRAVQVHISIIRIFFRLREAIRTNKDLAEKMEKIEQGSNQLFKIVFERLDQLEAEEDPPMKPTRRIGI